jgi:formylglycine-generating enzyme required for sulfatase activity
MQLPFDLIEIPAGEIVLRDDRKIIQWTVVIKAFRIAPCLVTQEFYHTVTKASPSIFFGKNKPVETVTWLEAVQFCNRLSDLNGLEHCYDFSGEPDRIKFNINGNGYRLPTEAEWEYACKSGTSGPRYGELDEIAWYRANSEGSTHDVAVKQANFWGLYDMLGNVWEWCNDIYDESVYGSYRIIRGGGWNDEARGVLATNRRRSHPTSFKIDDLGFRVAKNLG